MFTKCYNSKLGLDLSDAVYTEVKVHRMNSEMSGLVE